jgi:hypothetical protein
MTQVAAVHSLTIEPEHLGRLADRPLAETAPRSSPGDLFPGISAFLNDRWQKRRRQQWEAATPRVARLLVPGEHVLYVASGQQVLTGLQALSLGWMTTLYCHVLLVFTETRLIEVLMNRTGKVPESRLRSFPWKDVVDLKLRSWMGRLTLKPAQGKKHFWSVPLAGDRKLLALLLARLAERLRREGAGAAESVPLWHCPECGAPGPRRPVSCQKCGVLFRSRGLAACLSLAFPGAGLLYAGHPMLALFDFLGEVIGYVAMLMMLAFASGPGEGTAFLAVFSIFIVLTKLESLKAGDFLVTRTRIESPDRRLRFRRAAIAGGLLSTFAVAGAVMATGRLQPKLDHDIEVAGDEGAWSVSRKTSEWDYFGDDPTARARWTHRDGLQMTLFAYPLNPLDDMQAFESRFRNDMTQSGWRLVSHEAIRGGSLPGFRQVWSGSDGKGGEVISLHSFVYDEAGKDVHQCALAVTPEMAEYAARLVGDFLSHARWRGPMPPER